MLLCIGFALIVLCMNHYSLNLYVPTLFLGSFPQQTPVAIAIELASAFAFLIFIMKEQEKAPRHFSLMWWGFAMFGWSLFSNIFICEVLFSTPFSPIDNSLVKIDQWMGINTPALMAWTHQHPLFFKLLTLDYKSIAPQIFFIPLVLTTVFSSEKTAQVFYIANMLIIIVGCMIYYFFPTVSPAGVYQSVYFSKPEQDTAIRFYEVHHHLKITVFDGGLIAFPSFHVMWAVLLTYACRTLHKWIFYPVLCINSLMILSTLLLGWHYLIDVIAAFLLVAVAIVFAEKIVSSEAIRSTREA